MVRALRVRFSNAATVGDFDGHSEDLAKETDCIGEIILARQGRESTNPDKTFSTPSDNVPQGVPSLFACGSRSLRLRRQDWTLDCLGGLSLLQDLQ